MKSIEQHIKAKIKVLVSLVMSAAFEVIDQFILLDRLQCSFGVSQSINHVYLSTQTQYNKINSNLLGSKHIYLVISIFSGLVVYHLLLQNALLLSFRDQYSSPLCSHVTACYYQQSCFITCNLPSAVCG